MQLRKNKQKKFNLKFEYDMQIQFNLIHHLIAPQYM